MSKLCLFLESGAPVDQFEKVFPETTKISVASSSESFAGGFAAQPTVSNRQRELLGVRPQFYRWFLDRGFTHIMRAGPGCWPVRDDLEWWMSRDADIIAAPRVGGTWVSPWAYGARERKGGLSGAMLCKVSSLYAFTSALASFGLKFMNGDMTDVDILCGGLRDADEAKLPRLKFLPFLEQAKFCWSRPGLVPETNRDDVALLAPLTRFNLPSFVLDPSKDFADRYCLPREPPKTIAIFSSAVSPDDDYEELASRLDLDGKALFILPNQAKAMTQNRSGERLALRQRRLVFVHNFADKPPYGYGNYGEPQKFLRDHGYKGRYDTWCVRWSRFDNEHETLVTYDGETPDLRRTRLLRQMYSKMHRVAAPTCGLMVYMLLRHDYPDAKIYLVNFFGRTKDHPVYKAHDTNWEQAVYAQDPLVERVFTKQKEAQ